MNKLFLCLTLLVPVFGATAHASSADTVNACINYEFKSKAELLKCERSGAHQYVIAACENLGFDSEAALNRCIYSGADAATINACSNADFHSDTARNRCVGSKQNYQKIAACTRAGGDESDEGKNLCIRADYQKPASSDNTVESAGDGQSAI